MTTQEKTHLLKLIPWNKVLELADELLDGGMDKDDALDEIAKFLDTILPAELLLPGAVGTFLELVDGPLLRTALGIVVALALNPERRAERKEHREKKKAERKARKG